MTHSTSQLTFNAYDTPLTYILGHLVDELQTFVLNERSAILPIKPSSHQSVLPRHLFFLFPAKLFPFQNKSRDLETFLSSLDEVSFDRFQFSLIFSSSYIRNGDLPKVIKIRSKSVPRKSERFFCASATRRDIARERIAVDQSVAGNRAPKAANVTCALAAY